jgi:ubiquinone/menaquinone biosynthesis C-methylase UbiE
MTKVGEPGDPAQSEMIAVPDPRRNNRDIIPGHDLPGSGQDLNRKLDSTTVPNLAAVKAKQKATWESGDFGKIARSIENVAEEFMVRQPLRPGAKVLDVASGTGNLAVIAARCGCEVSGIDIATNLIVQARARAAAEVLRIDFREGDAEAMTYEDCQFDLVVSMFGVMFTPQPDVAAAELWRVTKPGGVIALANWTPEGFIGKMFNVFKAHLPPPPAGVPSPMAWGDETTVRSRLRHGFSSVRLTRRIAMMRYPFPPAETVEFFRRYYGPTQRAFASLDHSAQAALRRDLVELQTANNTAGMPDTTEVAAEYLEVVAVRSV